MTFGSSRVSCIKGDDRTLILIYAKSLIYSDFSLSNSLSSNLTCIKLIIMINIMINWIKIMCIKPISIKKLVEINIRVVTTAMFGLVVWDEMWWNGMKWINVPLFELSLKGWNGMEPNRIHFIIFLYLHFVSPSI